MPDPGREFRFRCPHCGSVFVLDEDNDWDHDNLVAITHDGHNTDEYACGVCGHQEDANNWEESHARSN